MLNNIAQPSFGLRQPASAELPKEIVIRKRIAAPVSPLLRQQARECLRDWVLKARQLYGHDFPMPTISFDLMGCTAGYALRTKVHVQLNAVLLAENPEEFFQQIIPHELAHLLTNWLEARQNKKTKTKIKPHGEEWQAVMRQLGLEPDRTHSLNTEKSRVAKLSRVDGYSCSCGPKTLSIRQHNRVLKGVFYWCPKCKEALKKDGQIIAPPDAVSPFKKKKKPTTPVKAKPVLILPTKAMLDQAIILAAKAGIVLPHGVRSDYDACSAFVTEQENRQRELPEPPTEAQLAYAKSIATKKTLQIPADRLANRKELANWIREHQ